MKLGDIELDNAPIVVGILQKETGAQMNIELLRSLDLSKGISDEDLITIIPNLEQELKKVINGDETLKNYKETPMMPEKPDNIVLPAYFTYIITAS